MSWPSKSPQTTKIATRRLVGISVGAEYADVSTKTMRRWIASGKVPGFRAGRLIKVDLNDVDAALRPIPTAGGAL